MPVQFGDPWSHGSYPGGLGSLIHSGMRVKINKLSLLLSFSLLAHDTIMSVGDICCTGNIRLPF